MFARALKTSSPGDGSAPARLVEYFLFEEKAVKISVEFLFLDGHLQNSKRAIGWDSFLVRPVGCGERVKHIADHHDFCLDGDFVGPQFVRVARAVQFLMVRPDNARDLTNFLGPWNLQEKIETVNDVRTFGSSVSLRPLS
jgi:hypothetical protein